MSKLQEWFHEHITAQTTRPLFDEHDLIVATTQYRSLPVLKRHPDFDALMVTTVENGLQRDSWRGFVYVMHWRHDSEVVPLDIGKAERKGRTAALRVNLRNIRTNHLAFGRWGYGLAYHIGDLSHVMFRWEAYKKPGQKYRRWIERLFLSQDPPTLHERVYVAIGLVGRMACLGHRDYVARFRRWRKN